MKLELYIDLAQNNPTFNNRALSEGWLLVGTNPMELSQGQDRLKVVVELPDKYFEHKIAGYGTVESITLVDSKDSKKT